MKHVIMQSRWCARNPSVRFLANVCPVFSKSKRKSVLMRHQSLIGRAVALVFFGIATASLGMLTAQEAGAAPQSSDGPATLPEIYIQTALSDTPAPGKTWEANTSADFQDRLNRAQCGDVIKLQAGATFAGQFYLPAKSCDDQHWIIVRTAASDSALPPEGTRLTPCYAGVSSLPARPALHCLPGNSAGTSVLAKIDGLPPLDSHGKAVDHYRFVGLEITHPVAAQAPMLLGLGVGSNHIVVDRCWI